MTLQDNDPLIEKWISFLELEDIPIMINKIDNNDDNGVCYVQFQASTPFLIQYPKHLSIWCTLHKLGYIHLAKESNKLDHLIKSHVSASRLNLQLESCIFDPIIERHFSMIDEEYKRNRVHFILHMDTKDYQKWINLDMDITERIYTYITDYLYFLYVIPEVTKLIFNPIIKHHLNITKQVILDQTKKQGSTFTNDDFNILDDFIINFEPIYNYDGIVYYYTQLKQILEKISGSITWT